MRTTILGVALATAALAAPATLDAQNPDAMARGAQVWADNCTRCHNARVPQERSDAEWQTIVLHMRARANLTRTDAALVTSFMQATNLPESTGPVVASPQAAAPVDSARSIPQSDEGGDADPLDPDGGPDLISLIRYLQELSDS